VIQERRQHARLTPSAPLFVSLGESKPGLVLDVCQGGVAVASLEPKSLDEVISLAFDLPEGNGHIQAKAEIAWTRDLGHLNGARFVELADTSRQQLEEWILARAGNARVAETVAAEPAEAAVAAPAPDAAVSPVPQEQEEEQGGQARTPHVPPQLTGEAEVKKPAPAGDAGLSYDVTSRYPIRLFLAVMLLSWALVFLGYRMGSTESSPQAREVTAAPKAPESSSTGVIVPVGPSSSTDTSLPRALPWNDPGVVLQVGAMKQENNADALAETLQKKKFPAFVFKRGADGLYRVAVGPYSTDEAGSTFKVKDELERQGFKPIVRRWLPE
jgi:cell division septation protein DedD